MMKQNLQKLTSKWQQRLRLQDWDIHVQFAHLLEMSQPDRVGEIATNPEHREAFIKILYPTEWPQGYQGLNVENILIHELLHIYTNAFAREDRNDAEEVAINMITFALAKGIR